MHYFLISLEEVASRGLHQLVALSTMEDSSHLLFSAVGPSSHLGVSAKRSLNSLQQKNPQAFQKNQKTKNKPHNIFTTESKAQICLSGMRGTVCLFHVGTEILSYPKSSFSCEPIRKEGLFAQLKKPNGCLVARNRPSRLQDPPVPPLIPDGGHAWNS